MEYKIYITTINGTFEVLLDEDTYLVYSKHCWGNHKIGLAGGYAYYKTENGLVYLHKEILGVTDKNTHVDHKNRNKLDNRRENLRISTYQQNNFNRSKTNQETSSKYKGVYWSNAKNGWKAAIEHNYTNIGLGVFETEIDAAKAYDKKALELFGEFACINFPEFDYSKYIVQTKIRKKPTNHNGTTVYKGIHYDKGTNSWRVQIAKDGIEYDLGRFKNEIEAATNWDIYSHYLFGDRAYLNFPENNYNNITLPTANINARKSYPKSQYIGVRQINKNKYRVTVYYKNKTVHIGNIPSELDAACVFDACNYKINQDKSRLNFPDNDYANYQLSDDILKKLERLQ